MKLQKTRFTNIIIFKDTIITTIDTGDFPIEITGFDEIELKDREKKLMKIDISGLHLDYGR